MMRRALIGATLVLVAGCAAGGNGDVATPGLDAPPPAATAAPSTTAIAEPPAPASTAPPAPPSTVPAAPPDSALPTTAPALSRIVVFGDSQTAGAWLADPATESWPAQLAQLRCPSGGCISNQALSGQPLGLADPTLPPPLLESLDAQLAAAGPALAAVVLIGQLDVVSSDDPDQVLAFYVEVDERLRASGVTDVAFITLLPYDTETSPVPEWIPTLEVRRTAINDGLRQRFGPTGQLIDVEPLMTEASSSEFRADLVIHDGNHPSAEGSQIIAAAVSAHLDTMLAD